MISIKKIVQRILFRLGYVAFKIDRSHIPDEEYMEFIDIYNECKPYTMTTIESMYSLYKAVEYIIKSGIPGDFVECGVWKGGNAMLIAKTIQKFGDKDRKIYLFDTFEGMSDPSDADRDRFGNSAERQLRGVQKNSANTVWCYASLEEVQGNMVKTGFSSSNIFYVKGKVEDTIPEHSPKKIALLRLDTDWYESTYHELVHLYPLITPHGILIIDDYGHWQGSKMATDQYFKEQHVGILLQRVTYAVRLAIKTS